MSDDNARADQIRARADAATDGPWYTTDDPPKALFPKAQRTPMRTLSSSRSVMSYPRKVPISLHWKADADFIAAARSDVPWLLDRLAAATERAEESRALLHATQDALDDLRAKYRAAFDEKHALRRGRDAETERADRAEAAVDSIVTAAEDVARRIPSPFADNVVNAIHRAALFPAESDDDDPGA